MKKLPFIVVLAIITSAAIGQQAPQKHLPIIDVHVHAMKVNPNFDRYFGSEK